MGKISYRWKPRANTIDINCGPFTCAHDPEDEQALEQIYSAVETVLEPYGFALENDAFVDVLGPTDGFGIEDFQDLAELAGFMLHCEMSKRGKPKWQARMVPELGWCPPKKSLREAVEKAFKQWTQAGRPIQGIKVTQALDEVFAELNQQLLD